MPLPPPDSHARNGSASPPTPPGSRERVGHTAEWPVALEILQRERKLPPPVRMLLDRARNIDLLALTHDVVERDSDKSRGGLRQVSGNLIDGCGTAVCIALHSRRYKRRMVLPRSLRQCLP